MTTDLKLNYFITEYGSHYLCSVIITPDLMFNYFINIVY